MWCLATRTRSIRDSFASATESILGELSDHIPTDEFRDRVVQGIIDNPNQLEEHIAEENKAVFQQIMSNENARRAFIIEMKEILKNLDLTGQIGDLIKTISLLKSEKIMYEAAKKGQIKGLHKVVSQRIVPDKFAAPFWTAYRSEDDEFILSDTCVFGLNTENDYGTVPSFGVETSIPWKEIYLPITRRIVLVGMREPKEITLSPKHINQASAAVSLRNFYSSNVNKDLIELTSVIGNKNRIISAEDIKMISEEAWSKS